MSKAFPTVALEKHLHIRPVYGEDEDAEAIRGRQPRIYALRRPSAVRSCTSRRSRRRCTIVSARVSKRPARLPPASCWIRTAATLSEKSRLRMRAAAPSRASSTGVPGELRRGRAGARRRKVRAAVW